MVTHTWRRWLSRAFGVRSQGRGPEGRRGRCRFTPRLVGLEDRVTPTTYAPTSFQDFPVTGTGISVNSSTGVITGGAGDGQVTLRSAIVAANANAGADTINLAAGTYQLTIA